MKTTVFELNNPEYTGNDITELGDAIYRIPILPAYAVLNHSLNYTSFQTTERGRGHPSLGWVRCNRWENFSVSSPGCPGWGALRATSPN